MDVPAFRLSACRLYMQQEVAVARAAEREGEVRQATPVRLAAALHAAPPALSSNRYRQRRVSRQIEVCAALMSGKMCCRHA